VVTFGVLALFGVLISAPVWVVRRSWSASGAASPAPPASALPAGVVTQRTRSDVERRTRTAWRALALLAVLLLAFALAWGQVIEEARVYAEVHGMPANAGEPERTRRNVLLAGAGVLLLAAALLRSSLSAGRRGAGAL
jgi:hypothetical protein